MLRCLFLFITVLLQRQLFLIKVTSGLRPETCLYKNSMLYWNYQYINRGLQGNTPCWAKLMYVLKSDVRQKRGLGSQGHWVRFHLTRRARPISLELFSIWRKFTQSCAEKFSNKGFKSSFEQACFAFFCR